MYLLHCFLFPIYHIFASLAFIFSFIIFILLRFPVVVFLWHCLFILSSASLLRFSGYSYFNCVVICSSPVSVCRLALILLSHVFLVMYFFRSLHLFPISCSTSLSCIYLILILSSHFHVFLVIFSFSSILLLVGLYDAWYSSFHLLLTGRWKGTCSSPLSTAPFKD